MRREIPPPPIPKPYRVRLTADGLPVEERVWAYDAQEAIFVAVVKAMHDTGSQEGVQVVELSPDFEAFANAYVMAEEVV